MENGYWVHTAPVGYEFVTVRGRGKMLQPREPQATIVREALEGFASGRFQSQAEVKHFFESFPDFPHLKNGHLHQQRVTDILVNPLYTGHICSEVYELNWLKGQHEALISLETYDKVQERRQDKPKLPARKNIGNDFIMRGFINCADCGSPLRSSWAKGNNKRYPYYLCQTKTCASYGKSIPRDKLEGDVAEIVKSLQPTQKLFDLVRAMFRDAWNQRLALADEMLHSAQNKLRQVEKQIEALLARVLEASNARVIETYEDKISALERDKLRLSESLQNPAPRQDTYEDMLELSLKFLANPWKIWETGNVTLKRAVLRLAFEERISYSRNQGARTPKTTLPFKALEGLQGVIKRDGGPGRTRTCNQAVMSRRL